MSLRLTNAEADAVLAEVDEARACACSAMHAQGAAQAALRHGVPWEAARAWATVRGMARSRLYVHDLSPALTARYDSAARTALVRVLAAREARYQAERN